MIKNLVPSIFVIIALVFVSQVSAQESTPQPTETPIPQSTVTPSPTPVSGPTYIVASGDSLTLIANRFGITLANLMSANGITDANQIFVGQPLIIPGLEGVSGILERKLISYGETLRSISRQYQIPEQFLQKLNKVTSPSELYAGVGFVLPKPDETQPPLSTRFTLNEGESLLELSVRQDGNPWTISDQNFLKGTWDGTPGEVLFGTAGSSESNRHRSAPCFSKCRAKGCSFQTRRHS